MSSSNVSFSNPLHDIEIPTVAPGTLTTPGISNTPVAASTAAPFNPVTSDAEAGLPNESTISHTLASGEVPTVHQQRKGRPPFTYLYWSICNLIFCCPVGCVALMFSMAAQSSVDKGQYEPAKKEARLAMYANLIGSSGIMIATALALIIHFSFHTY